MLIRRGLVVAAGVLLTAGAVTAKPPELPAGATPEGRELSQVVRDFYETEYFRPFAGGTPVVPARPGPGRPVADFFSDVRDAVLNRFTIPLGTAPVRE